MQSQAMLEADKLNATVGDQAFHAIRTDIINGKLKPGEKLRLEPLKSKYQVSVSTLREILNRLTTEDLVVAEGQRGFQVCAATEANLREIGDLRLLLENHGLALSLNAGDLEWEGRVVAAYHKLAKVEQVLLDGNKSRTPDWIRYDWQFHQAMVSACGSDLLMSMLSSVFDRFMRYHMLAISFRGTAVSTDHKHLFDLAMARDIAGTQKILAAHVNGGIDHILGTGKIG